MSDYFFNKPLLNNYVYLFKYIIIGESATGKSCCLLRFTENMFNPGHDMTIGVEFGARIVEVAPKVPVKIQVWDTAGMEGFRSITRTYYKNTAGVLLVFDVTRRESFSKVRMWLEEVRRSASGNPVVALIGNKIDRPTMLREVSMSEAQNFATENGLLYFETSALTGAGVETAFVDTAKAIHARVLDHTIHPGDNLSGVKTGSSFDVQSIPTTPQSPPQLCSSNAEGSCCLIQ